MAETATLNTNILLATELERDREIRLAAGQFIGSCLTGQSVELKLVAEAQQLQPIESLYDALLLARDGNEQARQMVTTNVATDAVERTYKSGHVTKTTLSRDAAGRIQQFGQSMESVQANSLRYASHDAAMLGRTKAETLNSFRIADYHERGLLKNYDIVVFSRAADDMSDEAMRKVGFFMDTMSTSIQVTSAEGDTITTESAFVAGKRTSDAKRHDAETIVALGTRIGKDLRGLSATELLATPLLIPKGQLQSGVIDLVKLYDEAAGGTFFGVESAERDYGARLHLSQQRETDFKPMVESVVDQLIADAHHIVGRTGAVQRLHQLVQDAMVRRAVVDTSINAQVFGPGAPSIVRARERFAAGDITAGLEYVETALVEAVTASCQLALKGGELSEEDAGDGLGPLVFTCKNGHPNRREFGRLLSRCHVKGCDEGSVGC